MPVLNERPLSTAAGLGTEHRVAGGLQALNRSLGRSYDRQAARYDAQRAISVNGRFFFDVAYRAVDEMLGPTYDRTIHLDLPVGTGRFFLYLRHRSRAHRMLGIDISRGMLQTCQTKAQDRSPTILLAMGDAFHLPLPDDSVDIITSMRFFHLLPKRHWPAVLAEMHRVIRPGGFVIAELRNLFRGLAAAMIVEHRDRWFRGGRGRSYVWPHQIRGLFRNWGRIETRGAGLDGLGRLSTVAPASAERLHEVTRYGPCRYLAKELLVKAYKRSGRCSL